MGLAIEAAHEFAQANRDAAVSVGVLQAAIDGLHGKDIKIGVDAGGLGATAGLQASVDAVRESLDSMAADAAMDSAVTIAALNRIGDAATEMAVKTVAANTAAAASTARAWVPTIGWFRLTATALHWIVAGSAELLAVGVPALIAFGAGVAASLEGAANVQQRLNAIYTTTEATANIFGQTVGSVLGLKSALQQAQTAADPGIYELLGSAVNDAKTGFESLAQTGLGVVHMWDEFAARLTVDLKGGFGTEVQGLLSGMTTDLQEFGNVLGNLGHALLNFAADMPGLAHVLLTVATGLSEVIEWASRAGPILTVAMAFEEFYRWGGLVLSLMVRLTGQMSTMNEIAAGGGFIARFGAGLLTLAGGLAQMLTNTGSFISKLGSAEGILGRMGGALQTAGAGLQGFAESLTPLTAAGMAGVVAGVAILIMELDRVRNASQAFIDTTNQAIANAPNTAAAMTAIANGIQGATARITQQEAILHSWGGAWQATGGVTADAITKLQNAVPVLGGAAQGALNLANHGNLLTSAIGHAVGELDPFTKLLGVFTGHAAQAASQVDQLQAAQARWGGEATQMITNANNLGQALHTTSGQALILADVAGVNLNQSMAKGSEAFRIAEQQILNLGQGYKAMGATAGQVGNDINAVSIEAGLQSSKVAQLTQAWDAYIGLLTGGTSALSTFEQSVTGLTKGTNDITTVLGKSGSATLSVSDFAQALTSFTGKGAQAWQNFNQVVTGGAQQFIDWMDNAAAAGVVSGGQMSSAIKGIVLQMLPLAAKSEAARAELAGLAAEAGYAGGTSLNDLRRWIGESGMSAKQLGDFINTTTGKLSDMADVASNLGSVLQSQLTSAFDQAREKASGFDTYLSNLASEISGHLSPASQQYQTNLHGLIGSMGTMHVSVPVVTAFLRSMGVQVTQAGVAAIIAAGKISTTGHSAATAAGQMSGAAGAADALRQAIGGLQSKTITVTTNFVQTGAGVAANPFEPGGTFSRMRAAGGDVTAHTPYLVGEAGKELFVPDVSGHIYSNTDTQRFLNSPGGHIGGGGAAPAPAAPSGGNLAATIHTHISVDGRELFEVVKTETARYATRNGNPQQGRLAPGRLT